MTELLRDRNALNCTLNRINNRCLNFMRLVCIFHSPVAGFSLLILEVSRSHTATQHIRQDSCGRSDQSVAETSTRQHTTLTTDRHPCPRWDSNPRSQGASGRRPTPQTARSLGPAKIELDIVLVSNQRDAAFVLLGLLSLYMFRARFASIFRSNTQNCNGSHQCVSMRVR